MDHTAANTLTEIVVSRVRAQYAEAERMAGLASTPSGRLFLTNLPNHLARLDAVTSWDTALDHLTMAAHECASVSAAYYREVQA